MAKWDVTVVGSGPNGLAAAVTMARAGLSVRVVERMDAIGGGARTAELTLPGFRHDVCSAVHPMALASPFFRAFGLAERIELAVPEISYAHPLDGGRAGLAWHDIARTEEALGVDGRAWRQLFDALVHDIDNVAEIAGSSMLQIPRHPITMAKLGMRVLEQGSPVWNVRFRDAIAPAMIAGVGAHAIGRMPRLGTSSVGMVLAAHAHARGWPIPIGGSQAIADALADDLRVHGGTIETGVEITDLGEIADSRAVLLDVSVRGLLGIAGDRLPDRYIAALRRYRYGNGVAKVDFALSEPVPWTHPELHKAGTLHLGGTRAEIARAEGEVAKGRHSANPYVLISQPGAHDSSRAPSGKTVLWAYTHVPHGSNIDQTEAIIRQIERFAPGFRETILATASKTATALDAYNPNYVGGDISSGAMTMFQLVKRPVLAPNPWRTPIAGVYLCSSATPPGPSVHGLCGWYAAESALRDVFGIRELPSLAPGA